MSLLLAKKVKLLVNDKFKTMFLESINSDLLEFAKQLPDQEFVSSSVLPLVRYYGADILKRTEPANLKFYSQLLISAMASNHKNKYLNKIDYPTATILLNVCPQIGVRDFNIGGDHNVTKLTCVLSKDAGYNNKSDNNSTLMDVDNLLAFVLLHNSNGYKESVVCDLLETILKCNGCNINMLNQVQDTKIYPMITALQFGYQKRVETILKFFNFDEKLLLQKDKDGDNLLVVAIKHGCADVTRQILTFPNLPKEYFSNIEEKIQGSSILVPEKEELLQLIEKRTLHKGIMYRYLATASEAVYNNKELVTGAAIAAVAAYAIAKRQYRRKM